MTKLAGLVVVSVATVSLATACGPVRSEAGHSLGAGVQVTAAAALPDPRNATYPDAEIVAAVVTGHLAHDSVVDAAAYLESIQHSLRCSIGFRPEWVPAGRAYALRERAARSSILEEIVAATTTTMRGRRLRLRRESTSIRSKEGRSRSSPWRSRWTA
jgi:hypothetical protein